MLAYAELFDDAGVGRATDAGADAPDESVDRSRRLRLAAEVLQREHHHGPEKNPAFAVEAGMAALRWLVEGYGYEITGLDVLNAYSYTMKAAENAGVTSQTQERIRALVAAVRYEEMFVAKILARKVGLLR